MHVEEKDKLHCERPPAAAKWRGVDPFPLGLSGLAS